MKEPLTVKDRINLATSILAIIISAIAFLNSEFNASHERERTIRSQLTDALSKMMSLDIENQKLFKEEGGATIYFTRLSSTFSQHNMFLIQQAIYLSDQIPGLITTGELNTIAVACLNSGDLITAEKYYKRAIDAAPSDYYKALATRSYAIFLFPQHRLEEGRLEFKKSTKYMKSVDNLGRATNGITYQRWAESEKDIGTDKDIVDDLYKTAETDFSRIDNIIMRQNFLKSLNESRGALPQNQ